MTIELNPITSGYSTGLINDNFQIVEDELNDNVLKRDGVEEGDSNQMEVDLDMNSHFVYNLPEPVLEHQAARLQDVQNAVAGGAANLITFTPYGTIEAENLQAAIEELIDETASLDVDSATGTQSISAALDRRVIHFDSIEDLVNSDIHTYPDVDNIVIYVARYWKGFPSTIGGGFFTWHASNTNHDGGIRIKPTVPWDGEYATHEDFLNGVGDTDPGGEGAWLRALNTATEYSPTDFGAAAGAIVDDNNYIFEKFEQEEGGPADLKGINYRVTSFPSGAEYYNGTFVRISDSKVIEPGWKSVHRVGNRNVLIGRDNATNLDTNNHEETNGPGYNLTAIGDEALFSAGNSLRHNTAIGPQTLYSNQYARYNVAVGLQAMYHLTGDSGDANIGSRNTAVGDNAARFNQGRGNIAMGRNSFQSNVDGDNNVAIGNSARAGIGPVWIDGETILNSFPTSADDQVLVGVEAGRWSSADDTVAVGRNALRHVKLGSRNTALGAFSLNSLESDLSFKGSEISSISESGTFSQTGDVITITTSGSVEVYENNVVAISFDTGVPSNVAGVTHYLEVISTGGASVTSFDLQSPDSATRSGDCTVIERFGNSSVDNGRNSTAAGHSAGLNLLEGTSNTFYGADAAINMQEGNEVVALGRSALRFMQSGSNATSMNNAVGVGYNTSVSGINQVQLGDNRTTTYAYGAVQDRSDERDKADIQPLTDAHIAFFLDVDWVMYRLDYRESYQDIDEEGNISFAKKDGSRKRNRLHIGAIAQQVEKAAIKHGVDFAGLQHHAVNGGDDVYSIGYQEFIGIQGEIIQRQQKRLSDIESRLDAAGL